ncbi:hypothetical protein Tco_1393984 [Tanacetum coccineum]
MSNLKFADTHNLVAFLSKPAENEGFEQIVNFRNAKPIKYALTINPTIYTSCIKQLWDIVKVKTVNEEVQLHALVDRKKVIITESIIRRDLQLENAKVKDMSHHKRIYVTPSHTKKIFGNMKREGKGFSRRVTPLFPTMMVQAQEEIDEAANEENVLTHSNDLLHSGEDSLKLNDLIEIFTKLQQRVLDLENTKTAQAQEISSLKLRVKRYGDDLVFDITILDGEEVFAGQDVVEKEVSTADPVTTAGKVVTTASVEVSAASATPVSTATTTTTTTITEVDLTLAQALAELRSAKPKIVVQEPVQRTTTTSPSTIPQAKSIAFRDPGESITRTTLTPIPSNIKDKGKAKMIEPEKPLKMKEQIRLDEELAFKLQAEEEEQARLAREKAEKVKEANISWDNMQLMIEADRLLAERLQAREQEELTDEEKERLFVELLEKRKKHFAALRA